MSDGRETRTPPFPHEPQLWYLTNYREPPDGDSSQAVLSIGVWQLWKMLMSWLRMVLEQRVRPVQELGGNG